MTDSPDGASRWVGRNTAKDVVRGNVWHAPIAASATCVHSSQVVAEGDVVMEGHDSALNFIATELELIESQTPYPQPSGVAWEKIRTDQCADIPFLRDVRAAIQARKGER